MVYAKRPLQKAPIVTAQKKPTLMGIPGQKPETESFDARNKKLYRGWKRARALKKGSRTFSDRLVEENFRLVTKELNRPKMRALARRYHVDFDDLEQVGNEGLIKAVRSWSPAKGALLSYARPAIWREMHKEINRAKAVYRQSDAWRRTAQLDALVQLIERKGRLLTEEEIQSIPFSSVQKEALAGIKSLKDVERLKERVTDLQTRLIESERIVALDEPQYGGNSKKLRHESIGKEALQDQREIFLPKAIAKLTPLKRIVILLRHFSATDRTRGKELNSLLAETLRELPSRVNRRALKKMFELGKEPAFKEIGAALGYAQGGGNPLQGAQITYSRALKDLRKMLT